MPGPIGAGKRRRVEEHVPLTKTRRHDGGVPPDPKPALKLIAVRLRPLDAVRPARFDFHTRRAGDSVESA